MSRTALHLATVAALTLIAAPATAQQASAPAQPPAAAQPAVPRVPATAEQRAAYDRLDPLSRSVFWAAQQEINPADAEAGVKLSRALRELGNNDQAVQAAGQVLVLQPDNIEALMEVGRAHIARGQAFYGIASLEKARDLAPNDWRPLSLLGVAYQQVRRIDDARAAWNEGLRLSPDNPDILANAAVALAGSGDAASAETLLRRAVSRPDATLKTRLNLAMVLGLQGKMAEAEQILRRDLPPEAADRNLEWLRRRGQTSDAVSTETARTWSSLQ
ncbi:MAG: tetratricopeptide repeat protein [Caulobacterales bacterium]|nr:tetratricopeptide repeat protein [Caulobacterales bacterium]